MDDIKIIEDPIKDIAWPHTITENTFDRKYSALINSVFKEFEDCIMGKEEELYPGAASFMSILFFPKTSRFNEVAKSLWNRTEFAEEGNADSMDSMVTLMMCAQGPNSYYPMHLDVERKQLTGVCYWGDGKNGTVFISEELETEVNFKHNRAFWFSNIDASKAERKYAPWHRYYNDTDKYRYTVNINYCTRNYIEAFLREGNYLDTLNKYIKTGRPTWEALYPPKN